VQARQTASPLPNGSEPSRRRGAPDALSPGGSPSGAWAWLWLALGGAICAAVAPLEPNLLEEGLMLHVGERMLAGDHLYRDIRLVTGPVPYALVAAVFSVFGTGVVPARACIVALQALACASVYGVARRADTGPGAHLAAAVLACAPVFFFPLLSTMFYSTVAVALVFPVGYLALRGTRSVPWAFAAGVLIALTALSKRTSGALLVCTMLPVVAVWGSPGRRARLALSVCAGGLVVAISTLLLFHGMGDLDLLVGSLLERPRGQVFGLSFINLWPPGVLAPELRYQPYYYLPTLAVLFGNDQPGATFSPAVLAAQVLFVLPVLVLVLTLLRRMAGPLPAAVWVSAATAAVLATNLFPRPDSGHLVFAAPAAIVHAVVLAFSGSGSARRLPSRVVAAAGLLLLAVGTLGVAARLYAISSEPSYGARVPLRPVSPQLRADVVPRVLRYLEHRLAPGEPIFVARAEPLVYFALEAPNPTPFTGALQVWGIRREQEDEILAALEKVRFVVMSDVDEPMHTYFSAELPRVQGYLERYFGVPETFTGRAREDSWLLVLERGPDRGRAAVDLLDPDLAPRAWLRSPAGTLEPSPGPWANLPTIQNRRPFLFAVGPLGGGVDYEIDLPEGARFQAGVGYGHIGGYRPPGRADFVLSLAEGDAFVPIASARVEYDERAPAYAWRPFEVDLSRFAGRRVRLRLEAAPDPPPRTPTFAIWGSPRIAAPPEAVRSDLPSGQGPVGREGSIASATRGAIAE